MPLSCWLISCVQKDFIIPGGGLHLLPPPGVWGRGAPAPLVSHGIREKLSLRNKSQVTTKNTIIPPFQTLGALQGAHLYPDAAPSSSSRSLGCQPHAQVVGGNSMTLRLPLPGNTGLPMSEVSWAAPVPGGAGDRNPSGQELSSRWAGGGGRAKAVNEDQVRT